MTGSCEVWPDRRERPVRLADRSCLEQRLIGATPAALGGEHQQSGRDPVEPVQGRQLGQAQLVAQPHHDALAGRADHAGWTTGRPACRRPQPLVAVDDVDLPGNLDLVGQVAVEPHEGVRRVGLVLADRRCRRRGRIAASASIAATSTRSGRRCRSQAPIVGHGFGRGSVAIRRAQPGRTQPVPIGKRGTRRHPVRLCAPPGNARVLPGFGRPGRVRITGFSGTMGRCLV